MEGWEREEEKVVVVVKEEVVEVEEEERSHSINDLLALGLRFAAGAFPCSFLFLSRHQRSACIGADVFNYFDTGLGAFQKCSKKTLLA